MPTTSHEDGSAVCWQSAALLEWRLGLKDNGNLPNVSSRLLRATAVRLREPHFEATAQARPGAATVARVRVVSTGAAGTEWERMVARPVKSTTAVKLSVDEATCPA